MVINMGEIVVLKEPSQDVLLSLKRLANDTCVYPGCEKKHIQLYLF